MIVRHGLLAIRSKESTVDDVRAFYQVRGKASASNASQERGHRIYL